MRHTLATWLQNAGYSEWKRGLILNHAGTSVTAGYSHAYAVDLKRDLLTKWADYVASLVQPKGTELMETVAQHIMESATGRADKKVVPMRGRQQ
jgi:hypothetical protein